LPDAADEHVTDDLDPRLQLNGPTRQGERLMAPDEQTLKRRAEVREAVLGPAGAPASYSTPPSTLAAPLLEWSESAVWDLWSRPGLPLRDRSLVTITALAIQGRADQLEIHLRAAARIGWTQEQIAEWINHLALYGGIATAAAALSVAQKVAKTS